MEKKCNCHELYDAEYFKGGYPYCPIHDNPMEKKYPIGDNPAKSAWKKRMGVNFDEPGAIQDYCFYEQGYYDAIEATPTGAVWVKASERLPGWKQPVKWRVYGVERKTQTLSYLAYSESPADLPSYEWLDESGQAQAEMAE